jgi:signal transduction histidine kinase
LTAIEDPEAKRLAPRLVASLDRAIALASATLQYGGTSERAPLRRKLVLRPLIDEAGQSVLGLADGNGSLRFNNGIDADLLVDADPEQLFRIVLNLMRNAADALAGSAGDIAVLAERRNGAVTVDVRDTGPGIPESFRPRLFQPFAGSMRAGGSGLGLAIARDLARLHGGDILLVDTGPQGTHFRIYIPDALS